MDRRFDGDFTKIRSELCQKLYISVNLVWFECKFTIFIQLSIILTVATFVAFRHVAISFWWEPLTNRLHRNHLFSGENCFF